jgi:hypothetical protein
MRRQSGSRSGTCGAGRSPMLVATWRLKMWSGRSDMAQSSERALPTRSQWDKLALDPHSIRNAFSLSHLSPSLALLRSAHECGCIPISLAQLSLRFEPIRRSEVWPVFRENRTLHFPPHHLQKKRVWEEAMMCLFVFRAEPERCSSRFAVLPATGGFPVPVCATKLPRPKPETVRVLMPPYSIAEAVP